MAIFGNLILESTVQVDDKTRLDGSKSFISTGEAAITLVEIEPEDAAGFIDVTTNKYLDWSYATDGTKVVSVRITTDGAPVTVTKSLVVVTAVSDYLFSGDPELLGHEDNIMDFVRPGRNSFLDKHRTAQDRILTILDEKRIWDNAGDKLTKASIVDIEEVNDWSKFLTLQLIFESMSNSVDDIFSIKALKYKGDVKIASNRAGLRLDRSGDAVADTTKDMMTFRLLRR